MILLFDVGNTNIVLGVYDDRALTHHWRVSTDKSRTMDEYAVVIKNLFDFTQNCYTIKIINSSNNSACSVFQL